MPTPISTCRSSGSPPATDIQTAERQQKNAKSPSRVLIVNGSSRNDQTCPGEISKTFRLAMLAKETIEKVPGFEAELLDLSRLSAEYGRVIYPCKACVSTAQPLCHWPCSCYPNHALGQAGDWMAEIYPKWVAAHGVMIVTPVNWYQAPSVLKLMIDRLVCADGGNPDPTSTSGKDPKKAKQLELKGWPYPRHLAGRVFSVVVHGDAAGTENLRRILADWLQDIGMIPSGHLSLLDRYVGYLMPYATSHDDLDRDTRFPGRRAQRGACAGAGGEGSAQREIAAAGPRPARSAAEVARARRRRYIRPSARATSFSFVGGDEPGFMRDQPGQAAADAPEHEFGKYPIQHGPVSP